MRASTIKVMSGLIVSVGLLLGGCSSTPPAPKLEGGVNKAYEADLIKEKAGYLSGDYGTVRPLFAAKAEAGNPVAQYVYGYMLFYGQGGQPDAAKSEKWIRKAAEQGHERALRALAIITSTRGKRPSAKAVEQ